MLTLWLWTNQADSMRIFTTLGLQGLCSTPLPSSSLGSSWVTLTCKRSTLSTRMLTREAKVLAWVNNSPNMSSANLPGILKCPHYPCEPHQTTFRLPPCFLEERRKKERTMLLLKFVRVEFNVQEENALFHQNLTFPRDLQAIKKQSRHTFKSLLK